MMRTTSDMDGRSAGFPDQHLVTNICMYDTLFFFSYWYHLVWRKKTHNSKIFPWKPAWSRSRKIQAFHQEEQECNINQAVFLKHNNKDNKSMAVYLLFVIRLIKCNSLTLSHSLSICTHLSA